MHSDKLLTHLKRQMNEVECISIAFLYWIFLKRGRGSILLDVRYVIRHIREVLTASVIFESFRFVICIQVIYLWHITIMSKRFAACPFSYEISFHTQSYFQIHNISPHLISSHLPLNCEGRWGTTDDFATSFLHFPLFSNALCCLPNSRPVHSLMLSSHLFLCLPCVLPPFTVHCVMVSARPNERETWPYHCSLRLFTMVRRSSCGPIACWVLARTSSLVTSYSFQKQSPVCLFVSALREISILLTRVFPALKTVQKNSLRRSQRHLYIVTKHFWDGISRDS